MRPKLTLLLFCLWLSPAISLSDPPHPKDPKDSCSGRENVHNCTLTEEYPDDECTCHSCQPVRDACNLSGPNYNQPVCDKFAGLNYCSADSASKKVSGGSTTTITVSSTTAVPSTATTDTTEQVTGVSAGESGKDISPLYIGIGVALLLVVVAVAVVFIHRRCCIPNRESQSRTALDESNNHLMTQSDSVEGQSENGGGGCSNRSGLGINASCNISAINNVRSNGAFTNRSGHRNGHSSVRGSVKLTNQGEQPFEELSEEPPQPPNT